MNLIPSPFSRSQPAAAPRWARAAVALAAAGSLMGAAAAELRLPAVFADGMVLQQKTAVAIWGTAEPNERVQVAGSWKGAIGTGVSVQADSEGRWKAELITPPAGGGAGTLKVSTASDQLEFQDVLLGEVWLCSGQSNMEWLLAHSIEAARASGDLPAEKTALKPGTIRHFTVPRAYAVEPAETTGGQWVEASGGNALSCSAAGYFFAQRLQEELNVPVGLIVSSWGGTTAQVWTSEEVVTAFPDHARTLEAVKALGGRTGLSKQQLDDYWSGVDDSAFFARRFKDTDFDDAHWKTSTQPSSFADIGLGSFDGVVWYRRQVEVPPSWVGSDLLLELPPIDDLDETFWNGERVGSLVGGGSWSKKRQYTIPAASVAAGQATLVIRALDTGGRGGFGAGTMKLSKGAEWIDLAGEWRHRRGVPASKAGPPPVAFELNHRTPASLYNAMIAPLIPYTIRGALWYQGESNRDRADEYNTLFPAMIMDWRSRWNDLSLPFYFVQLAPYDYGARGGSAEWTALIRDAQAKTTRLPMTGMALTSDIGNPRDIHPKNKWEVGRRLALFALRDLYGRDDIEPNGPTIMAASRSGNLLVLRFAHIAGQLSAPKGTLEHFEVKNADGAYVPAVASIGPDGKTVIVSAEGVEKPLGVRYLWNDAGASSVQGGTGLPMAPFRTTNIR